MNSSTKVVAIAETITEIPIVWLINFQATKKPQNNSNS